MDVLYLGFDPTFRDIIVNVLTPEGGLAPALPSPGHHHRLTEVQEIAGGNGVNVFRTLYKLNHEVKLVIPADRMFLHLLTGEGIPESLVIPFCSKGGNTTIALHLADGERQLNSVTMSLGRSDWSPLVHSLWQESSAHVSTNWGLNPLSVEWVACQLLSAGGLPYHELSEDPVSQVLNSPVSLSRPLFIDAGLLYSHPDHDILLELLNHVCSDPYCVILGNEEEVPPIMAKLSAPHMVIEHHRDKVLLYQDRSVETVTVPPLPGGEHTFVGAGDAFLAGFIRATLDSLPPKAAVDVAIDVAQSHILGRL